MVDPEFVALHGDFHEFVCFIHFFNNTANKAYPVSDNHYIMKCVPRIHENSWLFEHDEENEDIIYNHTCRLDNHGDCSQDNG